MATSQRPERAGAIVLAGNSICGLGQRAVPRTWSAPRGSAEVMQARPIIMGQWLRSCQEALAGEGEGAWQGGLRSQGVRKTKKKGAWGAQQGQAGTARMAPESTQMWPGERSGGPGAKGSGTEEAWGHIHTCADRDCVCTHMCKRAQVCTGVHTRGS